MTSAYFQLQTPAPFFFNLLLKDNDDSAELFFRWCEWAINYSKLLHTGDQTATWEVAEIQEDWEISNEFKIISPNP